MALPENLKKFLDANFLAAEELEILVVLRASENPFLDAVDIAKCLGLDPISTATHLSHLYLQGFVERGNAKGGLRAYRYRPISKAMEQTIEALALHFKKVKDP